MKQRPLVFEKSKVWEKFLFFYFCFNLFFHSPFLNNKKFNYDLMANVKKLTIFKKNKKRVNLSLEDGKELLNLEDTSKIKHDLPTATQSSHSSSSFSLPATSLSSSSSSSFFNILPSSSTSFQVSHSHHIVQEFLNHLDWLERYISGHSKSVSDCNHSKSLVDFINSRSYGNAILERASLRKDYGLNHLIINNILNEKNFQLNHLNKIFCSQWLSDKQIIFGTKCNKLVVLNVFTGEMIHIPNLKSSHLSTPTTNHCGIHCIEINPSRTLLATGGDNANDIAIYKLPTLEPFCVGENAHSDWIFDACWLDDQFFVTGSRDSTIALWKVEEDDKKMSSPFTYSNMNSLCVKHCDDANKIRAIIFNEKTSEIVALSLNAELHLFDGQTLKNKQFRKLPYPHENVCLAQESNRGLYAVGSKSHVVLVDQRTLNYETKIISTYQGIRSLSFTHDILTIGTGSGVLLFYDIRAKKYLQSKKTKRPVTMKVAKGWVNPEDQELMHQSEYNPAIYTHQYDHSGTRLFTAGGPLPASLRGNYAGLWT